MRLCIGTHGITQDPRKADLSMGLLFYWPIAGSQIEEVVKKNMG